MESVVQRPSSPEKKKCERKLKVQKKHHGKLMNTLSSKNKKEIKRVQADHAIEDKHIKVQYEKTMKLMNQKHQQQLRNISQQHERDKSAIQKQWKSKLNEMEHLTIEDEKKIHEEFQKELKTMSKDFKSRQVNLQESMNSKIEQMNQEQYKLKQQASDRKIESERAILEAAGWKAKYDDKEQDIEESKEKLNNIIVQMNTTKQSHEQESQELKKLLNISLMKLQHKVKVIEGLKYDISDMSNRISDLNMKFEENDRRTDILTQEKEDLQSKARKFQISAQNLYKQLEITSGLRNKLEEDSKRLEEEIDRYKETIKMSKNAINQLADENELLKRDYIDLRKKYEEINDKIDALQSALDKYQNKSVSVEKVLDHIKAKYKKSEENTGNLIKNLESVVQQRDNFEKELQQSKSKTNDVMELLQNGRAELQRKMIDIQNNEKHTYNLLEDCQERSQQFQQMSLAQKKHIQNLEHNIKDIMIDLDDDDKLREEANKLTDLVVNKDKLILSIKDQYVKAKSTNLELKRIITEYELRKVHGVMGKKHSKLEQEHGVMRQKHSKLEQEHVETVDLLRVVKVDMNQLLKAYQNVQVVLEGKVKDLEANTNKVQRYATIIEQLKRDTKMLTSRIKKCLYPGEKEELNNNLKEVLEQKQVMIQRMVILTTNNEKLIHTIEELKNSNDVLKIRTSKHEMDSKNLRKLAEGSAHLNNELIKSKKSISKKNKQLELLSGQLSVLINRIKIVTNREQELSNKLKFTSSQDEVDNLHQRVMSCRKESKVSHVKLMKLEQVTSTMKEQLELNKNKVKMLINVLKDSENAKEELRRERDTRKKVEEALEKCAQDKKIQTGELNSRIKLMEKQYATNLVSHEKIIHDSNVRIMKLQSDLKRLVEHEIQSKNQIKNQKFAYEQAISERVRIKLESQKNEKLRDIQMKHKHQEEQKILKQKSDYAADAITHAELMNVKYRKIIQNIQSELSKRKEEFKTDSLGAAIKVSDSNNLKEMDKLQRLYKDALIDKENAVMKARAETYTNLMTILTKGNGTKNIEKEMESVFRDGAKAENKHIKETIELRKVNDHVTEEHKKAKQNQWDMIHSAHDKSKQNITGMVQDRQNPLQVRDALSAHTKLEAARQEHVIREQADIYEKLQDQNNYINHVKTELLPKMKMVEQELDTIKFPEISKFREQIANERNMALSSLPVEKGHKEDHERGLSALSNRLLAMKSEQEQLASSIQEWIKEPNPKAEAEVVEAGKNNAERIKQNMQAAYELNDTNKSRVNFVIHPRTEQEKSRNAPMANENQMMVNKEKNQLELFRENGTPIKFHADSLHVMETPQSVYRTTSHRIALNNMDHDTIILGVGGKYREEDNSTIKYLTISGALEGIFPTIQEMSMTGSIVLSLVHITPGNKRYDLIGNTFLPDNCTYENCHPATHPVNNVKDAADIMNVITDKIPKQNVDTNHVVLSISVPGKNAVIHIVDILIAPLVKKDKAVKNKDSINSMDMKSTDIRLLDQSWTSYMRSVMEKRDTFIDVFFNYSSSGDQESVEVNNQLSSLYDRVSEFLAQYKLAKESK